MSWRRESRGGPRREDSVPAVEIREAFMEEMASGLNFVGRVVVRMLGRKGGESVATALTCPAAPLVPVFLLSIVRVALLLLPLIFRSQWLVGFPLLTDHLFRPFPGLLFFFFTLLPPTPNPTINDLGSRILHFRFGPHLLISWERSKAGREGDDRGWVGWMASLSRWTQVWTSSGSWWWQGAWCAAVHGVAKIWTRLSDWTELTEFFYPSICHCNQRASGSLLCPQVNHISVLYLYPLYFAYNFQVSTHIYIYMSSSSVFFFFFFWLCCVSLGSYFPDQGLNLSPWQ